MRLASCGWNGIERALLPLERLETSCQILWAARQKEYEKAMVSLVDKLYGIEQRLDAHTS